MVSTTTAPSTGSAAAAAAASAVASTASVAAISIGCASPESGEVVPVPSVTVSDWSMVLSWRPVAIASAATFWLITTP